MSELGDLLRVKLNQDRTEGADDLTANYAFYTHVAVFIDRRGFVYPTWGQWLDIRHAALCGRKVDAIKLLREHTTTAKKVGAHIPDNMMKGSFTEYVEDNATAVTKDYLGLKDAKSVIDWVMENEQVFNGVGAIDLD